MFLKKKHTAIPLATLSLVGPGTEITGDIQSDGDIRIDGTLRGNLQAGGRILIGPEGKITGDIYGKQADIMGAVQGDIRITGLLYLHGNAQVDGDVQAGQLQIDPSVSFNGQCRMGAAIVDISQGLPKAMNE